jgi:hypothetical protein
MSDRIPVPRELVEAILGNYPGSLVLGDVTYESVCALPETETTVPLTPTGIGYLFQAAWEDVENDGFNLDSAVEGTDPLAYAMCGSIESEERLRDLVIWAYGGVPRRMTFRPITRFTVSGLTADAKLVRRKDASIFATLEYVAGSVTRQTKARWVVASMNTTEPATEEEMRELCDVLGRLNDDVRNEQALGRRMP